MANWAFPLFQKGDPPYESTPSTCGGALGVVLISGTMVEDSLKKEDLKTNKQKNFKKKCGFFFPLWFGIHLCLV